MHTTPAAVTDRRIEIDTPEHVALGYALADLGSRFAALLLDTLLLVAVLLGLWLGTRLAVGTLADGLAGLAGWTLALLSLATFALLWGYFIYFEGRHDGQTPGKRAMGIRVVQDGGFPLTLRAAAIRNLVRFIDVQPIPTCLVGGFSMLLHPGTKRLGDLAAGTIVVRERALVRLPEDSVGPARAGLGPPQLGEEAWATLSGFITRRSSLTLEVRDRLASRLADRFASVLPRAPHVSDEAFLDELHADERARRDAAGTSLVTGTAAAASLVRRQQPVWREYHRLLDRARRDGVRGLPEADVSRFAALYRETAADLARARTYGASTELRYTLERIVGAGHNLLYRPPRLPGRHAWTWIRRGFPALVRRQWRPIALAALAFALPALLSFAYVRADPARAREVLPPQMLTRAEEAMAREAEGVGYVEVPDVFMPVMASSIIANNVQVTFVAFAGGLLAGLGTALILVLNGVLLGSVAALFANHDASLYLWTFVLPHGVIELTAIAIAGGAGFWMGSALLLPGRETRTAALARRGREAMGLLAGTVALLLVAGLIEGFISPAPLPRVVKLAAAGVFALLLVLYLLTPAAPRDEGPAEPGAGAR